MTLRSRLTLLIGGTLILALVSFSLALYLALAQMTLAMAEEGLANEASRLLAEKEFSLTRIVEPERSIGLPATYVQTLGLDREPLARSNNLLSGAFALSPAGLAATQSGEPWTEVVPKGEKRLLVYSTPVLRGESVAGVLQVARSLADRDDALASLRTLLISGALLTLVCAGLLGWVLAGATLRPLGRITHTAQAIGQARDFAQRLPDPASRDEVGTLATTLNGMLAELEGAHDQVAQTLQAQRRFIADASHELRTPLTTIRGYLALLDRDPPISPDDARTALRGSIAESDRLIRLVNHLFLLARTDGGQLQYRREPVSLTPLVESLVAQARMRAPQRPVTLDAAPDLAALGDADAIAQILLNLIDNALAHTPPQSPIVLEARLSTTRSTRTSWW
jgi:signal transduction histidine kinase